MEVESSAELGGERAQRLVGGMALGGEAAVSGQRWEGEMAAVSRFEEAVVSEQSSEAELVAENKAGRPACYSAEEGAASVPAGVSGHGWAAGNKAAAAAGPSG